MAEIKDDLALEQVEISEVSSVPIQSSVSTS